MEILNESKNMPIPWNMEVTNTSVPWKRLRVLFIVSDVFPLSQKAAIEYVLIHDDTNSVIDQTFAKDDRIELWVDLVLLKDGQNCYRICCRECGTESQAFNQGQPLGVDA